MAVSEKTISKLKILADAAKYDASCASSGSVKRSSLGGKGVGSVEGMGICHSYAPDGRCISLLKVLLTNYCMFDCAYCVNRASSDVQRARFTPREIADLTVSFYTRNYIEGLFLSSGIIRSPDYTMEQVVEVARILRDEMDFRGYIHLKTIPEASPDLLASAGRLADRLSINVELPTQGSLERLAPEKDAHGIDAAMGRMRARIDEMKARKKDGAKRGRALFSPGGQSTQMVIGADDTNDHKILFKASDLYGRHRLNRVYYSAYSPIQDTKAGLPIGPPPLQREHRLYQADWLTRFYGFSATEIAGTMQGGMLDLEIDPKLAWALRHREMFPVDLNRASKEMLLRVPGLGTKGVSKILMARRAGRLRFSDLCRVVASVKKVKPFVSVLDWHPGGLLDHQGLEAGFRQPARQADLFTPAA